jgi:hypothetical protein
VGGIDWRTRDAGALMHLRAVQSHGEGPGLLNGQSVYQCLALIRSSRWLWILGLAITLFRTPLVGLEAPWRPTFYSRTRQPFEVIAALQPSLLIHVARRKWDRTGGARLALDAAGDRSGCPYAVAYSQLPQPRCCRYWCWPRRGSPGGQTSARLSSVACWRS